MVTALSLLSLPAKAGNPVITAVSELALRLCRIDKEYWMLRLRGA